MNRRDIERAIEGQRLVNAVLFGLGAWVVLALLKKGVLTGADFKAALDG